MSYVMTSYICLWSSGQDSNTAGPQITSFCSTSFCYNVNEGGPGPMSVWGLQFLPTSTWIFSRDSSVSSHLPKMCMHGKLTYLNCPNPNDSECALWWKGILSRVGFHLVPWAVKRGSGHLWPWTRSSRLETNHLVFINLS